MSVFPFSSAELMQLTTSQVNDIKGVNEISEGFMKSIPSINEIVNKFFEKKEKAGREGNPLAPPSILKK